MSDSLSQEAIDNMTSGGGTGVVQEDIGKGMDFVKKLANCFANSASSVCSTSFNKEVVFNVSDVQLVKADVFKETYALDLLSALANITGSTGKNIILLKKSEAIVLAGLLLMEEKALDEAAEITDDDKDSIKELINQITGAAALSSGTDIGTALAFEQSEVSTINLSIPETDLKNLIADDEFIVVKYSIKLDILPNAEMIHIISTSTANLLAESIGVEADGVSADSLEFSDLAQENVSGQGGNLDLVLDIPVQVTVELGRTNMLIRDILSISQGSIIELTKLAGEPVDILVNDKLVARGEVVVIDENFGVRISSVVEQEERIKSLG